MSKYHLVTLNRAEYISSINTIKDSKTLKFANMSLKWWDKNHSWYVNGCVVLCDLHNNHLSYIFYKIDRYDNYMTIHNIFTPLSKRRHGYAKVLLTMIFNLLIVKKAKRFRLTCISNSLDFYLALGFVYWGVNSVGDYYCNLPMPSNGLQGVKNMIDSLNTKELIGNSATVIHKKINNNSKNLNEVQMNIYNKDLLRLKENYLQEKFISFHNSI